MPEIEWIKLRTDMPDDEKIKVIDTMPERDAIWVIFVKLLLQAGRCNQQGYIYLAPEKPFTDETLAAVFNRPLNTVRLALKVLQELSIIEVQGNGLIYMINFSKHQNIEGMDRVRKLNAERNREYRKRLKLKVAPKLLSEASDVSVTSHDATDSDIDSDIKNKNIENFSLFLNFLKANVNTSNYNTWVKNLVPVERKDHEFVLGASQEYIAEFAEKQMMLLEKAAAAAFGEDLKVSIVLIEQDGD